MFVAISASDLFSLLNKDEVLKSLIDGKSGITHSSEHQELGFRSQVYGKPSLDPEEYLEKKERRLV